MRYFPVFFDLKNRKVVVVGGGEEALRKIRLLLKTDANVLVVAENPHEEIAADTRLVVKRATYVASDLNGAVLVYSADPSLNEIVSRDAQARGIPVNAVDDAEISTFIVPSIVDRDPVLVAIGTEGAAPVLAQGIRAALDAQLPQNLGDLARRANTLRPYVAKHVPQGNRRRAFWQDFFFGSIRKAFDLGSKPSFKKAFERALAVESQPSIGRVSLVGAGPGDAELMTLKAHRRIQEADVIVYDRLIGPGILEMARRDAVRIPVGKTPYEPSPMQSEINSILIREAKKGLHVVRLKGGDAFIFGRGGEELAALEAEGIAVDVVPGVTAALGCAATAKLPLTQRGYNRSITLITGSSDTGVAEHDWTSLSREGAVFAIYMGVNNAGEISASLLDAGINPATPVTIVENGTLPNERVLTASIGNLWDTLQRSGIYGPAIIYVGLSKASTSADIVPFPVREDVRDTALRAAS
jgi:uroporphyrin-III C-methyltransferase / precorrin-2 dehydrogenase / sirohydrochlorin ferrochelatase